jgi:UDP-N-acetylmuramoyl-tripeptide--D-alanyl-D-alanine ligase
MIVRVRDRAKNGARKRSSSTATQRRTRAKAVAKTTAGVKTKSVAKTKPAAPSKVTSKSKTKTKRQKVGTGKRAQAQSVRQETRAKAAAKTKPAAKVKAKAIDRQNKNPRKSTQRTNARRTTEPSMAAPSTPRQPAHESVAAKGHGGAAAYPLGFAIQAMRGRWLVPAARGATFAGAAADSRRVRPGQLFFALPGERVDGFDYCGAAVAAGAAALVVDARRGMPTGFPTPGADGTVVPVVAVADPLAALADLARAVRATYRGRVVGITGSNGKTTTKELTAAALGAFGRVLRTEGNYNTEIGLPLTILSASGTEAFWVLEMAMRGRGQIALLADIAQPHVGVITNVAGAHVELLGSIEEVARAKGELFAGLGTKGIAVLPGGDPLIEEQAAHLDESRKVRFDVGHAGPVGADAVSSVGGAGADRRQPSNRSGPPRPGFDVVILETLSAGVQGQVVRYAVRWQPVVARLPLGGLHNARNGAAALAVVAALGLPAPEAANALANTILPPHRSAPSQVGGRIVLDDCYNANPASMRAALAAIASAARGGGQSAGHPRERTGSRAFAILGDMLELGPDAPEQHHAIGREAGTLLAGLAAVGPVAAEIARGAREAGLPTARVISTDDPETAAAAIAYWTKPGDWILVKASRGMRLERAIDALVEEFRKPQTMT